MQDYILLDRFDNNYYPIIKSPTSPLRFLSRFLSSDYRPYDQDLFINDINMYNITFVYNDLVNKILYIGFSKWEIDENVNAPDDEEFPNYVNETNSCKISIDNFIEIAENLMNLKKSPTPFAIMYRDDNNWISCQGFESKEEMELFVKSHTQIQN